MSVRRASLLALLLGCGRVGFEVCAGCGGDPARGIDRVHVIAPGLTQSGTLAVPIDVTEGDLLVVGTYISAGASPAVSDALGLAWQTAPAEEAGCGDPSYAEIIRFYYATVTASGADTISELTPSASPMGMFVVDYAGTTGVDNASGMIENTPGGAMSAGTIEAIHRGIVIALFADRSLSDSTFAPGDGYRLLAHDDMFSAMIEDIPAAATTYTPSATVLVGPVPPCWVGASLAIAGPP